MVRSGERGDTRAWCRGRCEALLWADHPMFGGKARFVRIGTMAKGEELPVDAHHFVRSKHPWMTVPEGVAAVESLPKDGARVELGEARMARLRATFA